MSNLLVLLFMTATAWADDAPTVRIYGMIRPTISVADGAMASYGRPNESAITSTANPRVLADPDTARLSWQIAQTRFGINARAGAATGVIELDFINFDVASPTVGAKPRLRIATVDWKLAEQTHLTLGQTWDTFAPTNPLHRNLVGGSFQAGNIGFMRQQAILDHKTEGVHLSAALGMPTSNNGVADGATERTPTPSATARAALRTDNGGEVGLAGFFAQVALLDTENTVQKTQAWGALASADLRPADHTQVRAEAFLGQNLQSTGMLSLAQARLDPSGRPTDLKEAGGWLSARQAIGSHWGITATGHGDFVLNPDDVLANYTPAEDPTAPGVLDVNLGPGMRSNLGGRVGVEHLPTPSLVLFCEGFALRTDHAAAAGDAATGMTQTRVGGELGALFTF